ncbi:MAG TPA: TIR domain-containing protein [Thermoanaerobaculia bacterium]|nr:TIR domain-containing protein [Thermoanaerobaculia bacterium]
MGNDVLPEFLAASGKVRLKVFVSYARADLAFTDQLVAAMTAFDFSVTIDRKGIHGAENWKRRLGQLILESDVVVFVLSPASAGSPVCRWEVEEAIRRQKRVIPVLARPLGDSEPYEPLRDLNYIHFYPEPAMPGSGFGSGLALLKAALSIDVEWIREHTRVGELASRWEDGDRNADLLLRGSELARTKQWRDARPPNAPELSPLQREFLQASEEAEEARTDAERTRLEERRKALEEAEVAAAGRREALAKLSRRTWMAVAAMAVLLIVLMLAARSLRLRNATLKATTEALELQRQETQQAVTRLEGTQLRLREGMKLKIAKTDRVVTATEKWYRIATDYKLAIGTYRAPMSGSQKAMNLGTGFLVKGDTLRPEWANQIVFITASHVIHSGGENDETNVASASVVFPGVGGAQAKFSKVLFDSGIANLDVAVLALAGPPPPHAEPVALVSQTQTKEQLDGVAVLQWTGADGFALGFGHGVAKPTRDASIRDDRMYYTHVTAGGASGAPVFDANSGNVVCLHVGAAPILSPEPRRVGFCTPMAKIVEAIAAKSAT